MAPALKPNTMRLDEYDSWKLRTPEEESNTKETTIRVKMVIVVGDKLHIDGVVKEVNSYLENTEIEAVEYDEDSWELHVRGDFTTYINSNWTEDDAADEAFGNLKYSEYMHTHRIVPEDVERI